MSTNAVTIEAGGTGTVTIESAPDDVDSYFFINGDGIDDVTESDGTITITMNADAAPGDDIVTVCAIDSDGNIITTSVIVVTVTAG